MEALVASLPQFGIVACRLMKTQFLLPGHQDPNKGTSNFMNHTEVASVETVKSVAASWLE